MDYWSRILTIADIEPIQIIALIGLLFISAFFSMSETVFSSVNVIRLKNNVENEIHGSRKALWITDNFDRTISTILVGNNLANVALATLSVNLFTQIFNGNLTLVNIFNTLVMTTIILIGGEIIPKSVAKSRADSMALKISGILFMIIEVLKPITFIFIKIKGLFVKPYSDEQPTVTEDELESIIDTMEEEGSIDEDEAEMLQSVLDLSDKTVYEIMTPRVDMIGLEVSYNIEKIKNKFFEERFSRLPVFENNRDNVIGILYERDFFTKLIKGQKINVKELIREPLFVARTMKVDTLIETLQRENSHMAIVTDEYGGTSGIVTMEDALEELVGEIYDEHDEVEKAHIQLIKDNKYQINADVELDELFEELELGKTPNTHYSTLGGWLYELFEDIPEIDDRIDYEVSYKIFENDEEIIVKKYLDFKIKEIKDRRITHVHLSVEDYKKIDSE